MARKQDLEGRLKRARSWIEAAKTVPEENQHARFVFFYVAFNALYGRRQYEGDQAEATKDRQEFLKRIRRLHDYDIRYGSNILRSALEACRHEGGNLITNYFLRNSYWRKVKKSGELVQQFTLRRVRAEAALSKGRYEEFIELVLERLTVLRNQIMHGCVTYGRESKGLPSLDMGLAVLGTLVPAFYELMERYGHHIEWPPIPYPRVGSESHPAVDQLR